MSNTMQLQITLESCVKFQATPEYIYTARTLLKYEHANIEKAITGALCADRVLLRLTPRYIY